MVAGFRDFQFGGNNYFYSGDHKEFEKDIPNWLYGRNLCREYCMDALNINTQKENEFVKNLMKKKDIRTLWTSGRLCDFPGCNGTFTGDVWVNGWFWSGDRDPIGPVNKISYDWTYNPWGRNGTNGKPQPDNAEFELNETKEACIAVFQNVYENGTVWNDVACYQEFHVLCEDNEELLNYVKATNPELRGKL